jgi:hypothetical protein
MRSINILTEYLRSEKVHPVIDFDKGKDRLARLDLTEQNEELGEQVLS